MTLTRSEYAAARDRPELLNGTAPPARTCEVCGAPLEATQKRTCSNRCAARLGGAATKGLTKGKPRAKAARRGGTAPACTEPEVVASGNGADGLLVLLASLPDDVVALDLAGGWRCVRT